MTCDWMVKEDVTPEYLEEAGRKLGPLNSITITGGEPSCHHKFVELAPKFREWFQVRGIGIETNGYGFSRFPEAFLHFDKIASIAKDGTQSAYSKVIMVKCAPPPAPEDPDIPKLSAVQKLPKVSTPQQGEQHALHPRRKQAAVRQPDSAPGPEATR